VSATARLREDRTAFEDISPLLGDLRFRNLLSKEAWASLPPATRRRFSKSVAGGHSAVYAGEVLETRWNNAGFVLVQLARLFGAPFPTSSDSGLPAVVTVTEDLAHGGQTWTRLYARRSGFPQVIQSAKRFQGPTGLEEYVGRGVGMALSVAAEDRALKFRSTRYFLAIGGLRLTLPRFLSPGALTVTHTEETADCFVFTLEVAHPRFGLLLLQRVRFREVLS
jgi:Domain of unknown function (DUF4166)